jgi:hypothetical protein
LLVDPVGDAVAADQHVKEQLDGQDRVALAHQWGGDVAVEGEREHLPGGGGVHEDAVEVGGALTLNQWSVNQWSAKA